MPNKHYVCPFSQLILSNRCGCQFSAKNCIAEKEFGVCLNQSAAKNCQNLWQNLKQNSDFVLDSHHQSFLSTSQQNKIKMGGLLGLQTILTQVSADKIDDIFTLTELIKQKYQTFDKIPFSQLMPKIAQFNFRQKTNKTK